MLPKTTMRSFRVQPRISHEVSTQIKHQPVKSHGVSLLSANTLTIKTLKLTKVLKSLCHRLHSKRKFGVFFKEESLVMNA